MPWRAIASSEGSQRHAGRGGGVRGGRHRCGIRLHGGHGRRCGVLRGCGGVVRRGQRQGGGVRCCRWRTLRAGQSIVQCIRIAWVCPPVTAAVNFIPPDKVDPPRPNAPFTPEPPRNCRWPGCGIRTWRSERAVLWMAAHEEAGGALWEGYHLPTSEGTHAPPAG